MLIDRKTINNELINKKLRQSGVFYLNSCEKNHFFITRTVSIVFPIETRTK